MIKTAIKNLMPGSRFIHKGATFTIKTKSPIIGSDESGKCKCFHPEYKVYQVC